MAFKPTTGCFPDSSCGRPPLCKTPSSSIFYDGENLPEAGVYHGAPLNTVIGNLARYVSRAISVSGAIRMESFIGTSNVKLSRDAAEILQVTYCGGVLPKGAYELIGRKLAFCKDYCFPDEFSNVQVTYREKALDSFVNC